MSEARGLQEKSAGKSAAKRRRDEINDESVGKTGRRVLLVEGKDDVNAFSQFLDKRAANWTNQWVMAEAGNKKLVLQIAQLEPNWVVLVDHDEWSPEQRAANEAKHANLFVLPRFCLESYLCDPVELWQALPAKQKEKLARRDTPIDSAEAFGQLLLADLPAWRRHAALWHVINPLWSGIRALGFQSGLLDAANFPDDEKIRQTLKAWHQFMDENRIWQEIELAIESMQAQPLSEFLHKSLYAKEFFPRVVKPKLGELIGQKASAALRDELFKSLAVPTDLEPLWQKMGL